MKKYDDQHTEWNKAVIVLIIIGFFVHLHLYNKTNFRSKNWREVATDEDTQHELQDKVVIIFLIGLSFFFVWTSLSFLFAFA